MGNFLKDYGQPIVYKVIEPLIQLLAKTGVTPNHITLAGFVANVGVAMVFVHGANQKPGDLSVVGFCGFLILFAGLFDMMDGRLARVSGQASSYGALLDSVLDRYSELVMFLGICYYLSEEGYFLSALFAFIAMIGSIMVSYVRARAEGLGISCDGGWMQRPERILTIGLSAMICGLSYLAFGRFKYVFPGTDLPMFESITIFTFPIFLLAILTNFTAIRRLQDAKKALEKNG